MVFGGAAVAKEVEQVAWKPLPSMYEWLNVTCTHFFILLTPYLSLICFQKMEIQTDG